MGKIKGNATLDFIGHDSSKGTFYWHSARHNGWVIADLDLERTKLCSKIAVVELADDAKFEVESVILGDDGGDKILIDQEQLIPLLREYPDDVKVLWIGNEDGTVTVGDAGHVMIAGMIREISKKAKHLNR